MMNVIYGHITTTALTVQSPAALAIVRPGAGFIQYQLNDGTVEFWRVRIFAGDGFIQYQLNDELE